MIGDRANRERTSVVDGSNVKSIVPSVTRDVCLNRGYFGGGGTKIECIGLDWVGMVKNFFV